MDSCDQYVTSRSECESAAKKLNMGDNTAYIVKTSSDVPPYCYYSDETLWYNPDDSAKSCSSSDICICKQGGYLKKYLKFNFSPSSVIEINGK